MRLKTIFTLFIATCFLSGYSQKINVSYTAEASAAPFTGKVFLYLSKDHKNPKDNFVGLVSFQCYSIDVKNIKPGENVQFDDKAISYPVALSDLERGKYYIQAVWDRNLGGRSISESAGNMYNETSQLEFTKDFNKTFAISCSKINAEEVFKDTKFVKEMKAPSALLSGFYKRAVSVNAAVLLPESYYSQPNRKFPVLFKVSGFGGDYHHFSGNENIKSQPIDTTACIQVYLDGSCPLGHSVYANSDNNGPWGDALVKELIPAIEKNYRSNGARLLTGHSSGGWTVLWLQTQYPDTFAGCWSSSPDPVDFRNFQQVNLYEDTNIFYDKEGGLRSVATVAGFFPWASMKTIYQMENVIYRGEQIHSFDAVFSVRQADGSPRRLCNADTGIIDHETVEHWKKYDISLNLRTNWDKLKPSLDGKIRISIGNQDNFLLNHAVHLLEDEMKKKNANLVFQYYPGDHFTVSTPEYVKAGNQFLQQAYVNFLKKLKP